MSRSVKLSCLIVLTVFLATLLGLGLFLSSDRFDSWARTRLTTFLEDRFQLEVHFGRMKIRLWRGLIELEDLQLADRQFPASEPAIAVRQATINVSLVDYLRNDLPLDEVSLDGLRLRLRRDPNGRLNLANMFSSGRPSAPSATGGGGFSPLKVKITSIHLRDAKVWYEDRLVEFNTDSEAFRLNLTYDPAVPAYNGAIQLHGLHLEVDGFPIPMTDFESRLQVESDGIRFHSIRTSSDAVTSQMAGAITSFSPFEFSFDVSLDVALPKLQRPDLSRIFDRGEVDLRGRVQGGGGQVTFDGDARSEALEIKGLILESVASRVHVDEEGARAQSMTFRVLGGTGRADSQLWWSETRRSSADVTGNGMELRQALSVFGVTGLPLDGTNALSAHLTWPGVNLTEFAGPGELSGAGRLAGNFGDEEASIPYSAKASLLFGENRIRFSEGSIQAAETHASCEGHVTFDGETALTAEVQSSSSQEVWTIGRLFGLIPESFVSEYSIAVGGSFDGRVALQRPAGEGIRLQGWGETASLLFRGKPEGRLSSGFRVDPTEVEVSDLELVRDSSQLKANLMISREPLSLRSLRLDAREMPLADLARLGLVDPSLELSGRGSVQADLQFGPNWIDTAGTASVQLSNAGLYGETVRSATAQVLVHGATIRVQALRAELWAGQITGGASYNLESAAFEANLEGEGLALGQSPLAQKAPELGGTVSFSLEGSGTPQAPHLTLDVQSPEIRFGSESLASFTLKATSRDREVTFSGSAGYLDRPLQVDGSVQVVAPYPFEVRARITDLDLTPFLKEFTSFQLTDFSGSVGASVEVSGDLSDLPAVQAKGTLPSLEVSVGTYGVHLAHPLKFSYQHELLTLDQTSLAGPDTDLSIGGTANFKDSQLSGKVSGGVNLRLVNAFLSQGEVQGELQLETSIAGPFDGPRLVGTASLSSFFLSIPDLPVNIEDGRGTLKFTSNQVSIDSFSGRTDYGNFGASGGIFLEGLTPVRWQVNVTANSLNIPYPAGFTTILDADVDFAKAEKGELLSGAVYIRSAEFDKNIALPDLILQLGKPSTLKPGSATQKSPSLDLTVEAYRSLRINNNLADIVASGDFSVVGTLDDPIILGSLTIDDGALKLEGNDYEITRGTVNFDNPRKTNPYFNFEAETQVREYEIFILIRGPLDRLQMTFRSEPPLSTANIVSLLAAGQTEQEILGTDTGARTSSGTLAAFGAGTLLTKTLGASVENQASRLFGIDRFSIDPFVDDSQSRDPGARITLGKQITKELGVSYISSLANSFQEQTVVIEYKLTDWLTVVGTSDTTGVVGIDFKLRKRF